MEGWKYEGLCCPRKILWEWPTLRAVENLHAMWSVMKAILTPTWISPTQYWNAKWWHRDIGAKLDRIVVTVDSIKNGLEAVFKITKDTKCLKKTLKDTFKCNICTKSPMRPPVIFARYCKRIMGCQACIDEWYVGSEQTATCPVCRSERAYADTTRIRLLDDFLNSVELIVKGYATGHDAGLISN